MYVYIDQIYKNWYWQNEQNTQKIMGLKFMFK